jgi:uncharacterized protein YkwD
MSIVAFVLTTAMLAGYAFPPAGPAHESERTIALSASGSAVEREADARAMLETVNAERAQHGLPPLTYDERLSEIAREHARDMVLRSYFAHETPEGETPFDRMARSGYRFSYAGENIALDGDVNAASRALFASIEHRENILQPHFNRVGIAAIASTDGEVFVEDFSD